jgi:hypothetical protein
MKKIISIGFILAFFGVYAQEPVSEQSNVSFFAQAIYDYTTDEAFIQLEENLKSNPYVKLIRLDKNSETLFLVTKDINAFDIHILESWLTTDFESVSCVHIGIYGLDKLKKYPNEACK